MVTFGGGRRRESAEEQRNHIADCLKYHRERCLQIKNLTNITRSDNNLRYHMASCPLPLSSFSRASGKKGKQHQQQQERRRIHKILRSEKNLKTHFETTPMCCCCCYCCLSSIHFYPHRRHPDLSFLPFYLERNKYMPTINVYCCLLSNCYCFSIMMPALRKPLPPLLLLSFAILHLMAVFARRFLFASIQDGALSELDG